MAYIYRAPQGVPSRLAERPHPGASAFSGQLPASRAAAESRRGRRPARPLPRPWPRPRRPAWPICARPKSRPCGAPGTRRGRGPRRRRARHAPAGAPRKLGVGLQVSRTLGLAGRGAALHSEAARGSQEPHDKEGPADPEGVGPLLCDPSNNLFQSETPFISAANNQGWVGAVA